MDPRIVYSVQSALLFFLVAFVMVTYIMKKVKAQTVALAVSAVLFGLVVYVLMLVQTPKAEGFATRKNSKPAAVSKSAPKAVSKPAPKVPALVQQNRKVAEAQAKQTPMAPKKA